jgi:hypothetical protein
MFALPSRGTVVHAALRDGAAHPRLAVRETGPDCAPKPRLLDRVRDPIRARHYSRRTEKAYVHGKRHPAEMGAPEVTKFLTSLAVDAGVAASTQNQALSALLFLYCEVLAVDLPWLDAVVRAKRPERLPVVLTREEVDLATHQITVRSGKGDKDRLTMLPALVMGHEPLSRPADRPSPPASPARVCPAASGQGRRAPGRDRQAPHPSHAETFVRHPSARRRPRHPHRAGTARTSRRDHDTDLYPRSESGPRRGPQPSRPAVRLMTTPPAHRHKHVGIGCRIAQDIPVTRAAPSRRKALN